MNADTVHSLCRSTPFRYLHAVSCGRGRRADVQRACALDDLLHAVEAHVGDHLAEGPVPLLRGPGLDERAGGGGGGVVGVGGGGEGGPGGKGGGGRGGGRGRLGGGKGELEEGGVAGGDDGEVKRHGGTEETTRATNLCKIHLLFPPHIAYNPPPRRGPFCQ